MLYNKYSAAVKSMWNISSSVRVTRVFLGTNHGSTRTSSQCWHARLILRKKAHRCLSVTQWQLYKDKWTTKCSLDRRDTSQVTNYKNIVGILFWNLSEMLHFFCSMLWNQCCMFFLFPSFVITLWLKIANKQSWMTKYDLLITLFKSYKNISYNINQIQIMS